MKIRLHPSLRMVFQITLCLCLALILQTPMIASAAQSWDDIDSAIGNTPFYDPNAVPCSATNVTNTSSNVNLSSATDNMQQIWDWLVGQGLTGAEAAGIMGNIQQESDFDPTSIQGGGDSNDPAAAGGGGWGLFQWTPGTKVLSDQKGAGATGSIDAIPTQLQIAWWEAQGNGQWAGQGNTVAKIAAVTGNSSAAAAQAANIWVSDFEHAGIIGPRGAYADAILALAKQKGWPNANATAPSGKLKSVAGGSPAGGNTSGNATVSNVNCCPPNNAPSNNGGLGTFSALTGSQAISGTFVLGFTVQTPKTTIENVFKKYKPAGLYLLGTNVPSGGQSAASYGFNAAFFQALALDAGHPIIVSSDEEGLYTRYSYNFNFPTAGQMSKMTNAQVQSIGEQVGAAMASNGLNTDLAPVLDVGTGNNSDFHQQPGRTFGTNAATVTAKAGAFAQGLASGGVKPVYKHFPGLGSSSGNTDLGPVTSPNITQLEKSDLLPYQTLANQNGGGVMMDNAMIPGLTGNTPASQSAAAVSLLRNKYGFNGLVLTDDLYAKSVSPSDSPGQLSSALAKALEAGVDAPLETYTSNAVLDAAIAQAKAAHVNTQAALNLLDRFVPPVPNTSTTPTSCNANPAITAGKVIDPFPGGWQPSRLDMGYDGTFKGQIVAPFNGTIYFAGVANGWDGTQMVVIHADQSVGLPNNSQNIYFAEGINAIVKPGTHVNAGTPIANAVASNYNGIVGNIEWGVADAKAQQGYQPNTEAVVIGFNGTCSPSSASKAMVLAFYSWAQNTAHVPGNATNEQCAGAS